MEEFRSTYSIEFPLLCRIMSKWPYKTLLSFIPRWKIQSNCGFIKKFCHNSSMNGIREQIQPPSTIEAVEEQMVEFEVSEIGLVMKRLGLEEDGPIEGPHDFLVGLDEIEGLFEEEEPSFEEVKEAFDVFDRNRDGFIDDLELHRVLSNLGLLKGGSYIKNLEICGRILCGFDHKGVGLVDLIDFVRLVETCF